MALPAVAKTTPYIKQLGETFAGLSPNEKATYHRKAKSSLATTQVSAEESNFTFARGRGFGKILKTVLHESGDTRSPLSAEAFDYQIRKQMQTPGNENMPGFSKYSEVFRKHFLDDAFVEDAGLVCCVQHEHACMYTHFPASTHKHPACTHAACANI